MNEKDIRHLLEEISEEQHHAPEGFSSSVTDKVFEVRGTEVLRQRRGVMSRFYTRAGLYLGAYMFPFAFLTATTLLAVPYLLGSSGWAATLSLSLAFALCLYCLYRLTTMPRRVSVSQRMAFASGLLSLAAFMFVSRTTVSLFFGLDYADFEPSGSTSEDRAASSSSASTDDSYRDLIVAFKNDIKTANKEQSEMFAVLQQTTTDPQSAKKSHEQLTKRFEQLEREADAIAAALKSSSFSRPLPPELAILKSQRSRIPAAKSPATSSSKPLTAEQYQEKATRKLEQLARGVDALAAPLKARQDSIPLPRYRKAPEDFLADKNVRKDYSDPSTTLRDARVTDMEFRDKTLAAGLTQVIENKFMTTHESPLSTFSIDVDTASYSNTRQFLRNSVLPPRESVRIEEFLNYFDYSYPEAKDDSAPFAIATEYAAAPWNSAHTLLRISLKGYEPEVADVPPSNLVFLIDVSGSMSSANKLPLLKSAFKLLVSKLGPRDRISIVTYAGAAGEVLPPTRGDQHSEILSAIEVLTAGGSTAGGAGIELAYKLAKESFIDGGNNRVILATDGDFNVGISDDASLVALIEEKRRSGVFLSVLGFGTGNYKDTRMEQLANKGNGNYAYIDNAKEAKKVLVEDIRGTLFTIAKDVKIQLEFNPARVQSYRLIGYENRMLKKEDFNDDTRDAGELGAGHRVTAFYEIVPAAAKQVTSAVDPLRYQSRKHIVGSADKTPEVKGDVDERRREIATVKLRYKLPEGDSSKLLTHRVDSRAAHFAEASTDFRFASAVAQFAMILRGSSYVGEGNLDSTLEIARTALGTDKNAHRREFLDLVETAKILKQ